MNSNSGMRVDELSADQFQRWDTFVQRGLGGSVYSLSSYLKLLCEATGGSFRILAVTQGTNLLGGLAVYTEQHRSGGIVSNRPLLYRNGFVLLSSMLSRGGLSTQGHEVLSLLARELENVQFTRVIVHSMPEIHDFRGILASPHWAASPTYSYVVPLEELGGLFSRLSKDIRRSIHRAEEAGVTVTMNDAVADFVRLHGETASRKGAQRYLPGGAFERLVHALIAADLATLYHARIQSGEIVSSQLVLTGNLASSHTVCAAATEQGLPLGATSLLRWRGFQDLAQRGFQSNDLTDASLNSVTRFKAQLGGDLRMSLALRRTDSLRLRIEEQMRKILRGVLHR